MIRIGVCIAGGLCGLLVVCLLCFVCEFAFVRGWAGLRYLFVWLVVMRFATLV